MYFIVACILECPIKGIFAMPVRKEVYLILSSTNQGLPFWWGRSDPSSSGDWNVVHSQASSLRRIHPWWCFGVMSGLLTHLFLYVLADYSSLFHPSGLQICELLFCCWDKNTTAKVTYRKRVYFNWWLQRAENLSWWEGMTSSNRHGSRNWKLRDHSFSRKHKTKSIKRSSVMV